MTTLNSKNRKIVIDTRRTNKETMRVTGNKRLQKKMSCMKSLFGIGNATAQ